MTSFTATTDLIRGRATELGFDLVGFAAAGPFTSERELILESLAQGRLAGMAWITPERVSLSCDPEALLPGARTIVALGTAYAPLHALSQMPRAKEGRNAMDNRSAGACPPPSRMQRKNQRPSRARAGDKPPRYGREVDPAGRMPAPSPLVGEGWDGGEIDRARSGPVGRVARYARGRDYHDVIPPRLRALAAAIVELCGPETKCRTFVDTGPLVDRAAAERAGLGFVGKNTCLLTGRYGSYVFLSAILTTAALPSDPFVTRDCGSCRACLNACPTGAFIAPRQLDATRCISYLTIEHRGAIPHALRPRIEDWVFGCDVCQEVCPWNRARSPTTHEEFAPEAGSGNTLDLAELLTLDEAAFRARFRGTPLMRTKRRGLLRNAAIALGNSGDRAVIPALLGALSDAEPLVRGHAAWALGELAPLPAEAIATLRTALAAETDPEARAEMRAALGDP